MALKRIYLNRTVGEWQALQEKINELGKSDLSMYLRSEIPKIQIRLNECPQCVTPAQGGEKEQRVVFITEASYETISVLSNLMGNKPLAAVIDDLLITPLLLEK